MPQILQLPNPFDPQQRTLHPVEEGSSLYHWMEQQGISEFHHPTLCLLEDRPLLRAEWSHPLQADQTLILITLPQGGGEGKNPLRTILMVAVMVAAPQLGASLASSMGVSSTLGVSLVTAGVGMVGSAVVNALVPPALPSMGDFGAHNLPAPSPTYALQGQGNRGRLGQPIPVIYGRHLIYPDLAATPYSDFENNDHYLYQLHVIGQGEYEIETIRIEDTPIHHFEERSVIKSSHPVPPTPCCYHRPRGGRTRAPLQ